jgi:hypothetical protein
MGHEMRGEPAEESGDEVGDTAALYASIDEALDPPGPLDWDRVMRHVWFAVDRDPDAPTPQDVVDRVPPPPDDQLSD